VYFPISQTVRVGCGAIEKFIRQTVNKLVNGFEVKGSV
jgi:hypothetical protein